MSGTALTSTKGKTNASGTEDRINQLKLEIVLLHNASSRGDDICGVQIPLELLRRRRISSGLKKRYKELEGLRRA